MCHFYIKRILFILFKCNIGMCRLLPSKNIFSFGAASVILHAPILPPTSWVTSSQFPLLVLLLQTPSQCWDYCEDFIFKLSSLLTLYNTVSLCYTIHSHSFKYHLPRKDSPYFYFQPRSLSSIFAYYLLDTAIS